MKIQFYNTLSNRIDEFKSLESGKVKMYSCGPTVYDYAHIGNFRSFLFGDLLRRFLELAGYDVTHVMNITDVGHMTDDANADGAGEDKMNVAIKKMKETKKSGRVADGQIDDPNDPYQIAQYFTDAFLEDARQLGYKVAFEFPQHVPKATDHIKNMQTMILELLDRGHAYIADDGVVYFSVESFEDYGQLSGNSLTELKSGAGGRVHEGDQMTKQHPADFLLWKPDRHHIMKWDSPWGVGYPGWHIECSVMARALLGGDRIDIHTGGEDLIFPHHECEIAQSRGASGESHFANFWIHARFLFVEGEKMSKSKGSFYTLRDVMSGNFKDREHGDLMWGRSVDPAVIRYELIKAHYRSKLNFTSKGIVDSATAVRRLQEFRRMLETQTGGESVDVDLAHPVLNEFASALADDLNISAALAVVHPWISSKPNDAREALGVFKQINSVLAVAPIHEGLNFKPTQNEERSLLDQVRAWCKQIDEARAAKDYSTADTIRQKCLDAGYEVRTTKEGTVIQKELV